MNASASAREAARRGHPEPAAKPPTWDEALAHAKTLQAQGVDVRIDERWKTIEIRGANGELNDPGDDTPAHQWYYPDGTPKWISHFTNGKYHDPADGTPAWQTFYPDGTPMTIGHFTNGKRHDPADGTPAVQDFYRDGTPMWISHYTNGELISTESFPPPTGEA